jgi:putative MATE family efflux protein
MEQSHDVKLEKKITTWSLLSFALPTIIAMVGMGISGVVDGIFAARFIDAYALSAVGLVAPFIMFSLAIGFMLGIGGNALVAKEIGEGRVDWARKDFSLIVVVSTLVSAFVALLAGIFPDFVLNVLGVNAYVHEISLRYMMPLLPFLPIGGLGMVLQQFMITEGKAHYGMIATILSGIVSALLNFVFIYQMHMGIRGAALATGIAYAIPAAVGILFFMFNRRGTLYFVIPKFKFFVLVKSATNGISEMVTMLSTSITQTVMNNILMDIDGPMAVASAGIIAAGVGLAANVYIGYSSGIAPIIAYNFGKKDHKAIKSLFQHSIFIVIILALVMQGLIFLFTDFLIQVYDIDPFVYIGTFMMSLPVYDMAFNGLRLVSLSFMFMAVNTFSSIMFTSFNDGKISGVIALCNGFIFILTFLFLFPPIWGVSGVWVAMPASDLATLGVTIFLLFKFRKKFNYA